MTDGPLRFPPDPSRLRRLRSDVRARAELLGASPGVCDAAALVVDELVNNAIEHGAVYRRLGTDLTVVVAPQGSQLGIEFIDPEMPDELVRDLARALRDAAGGMPSLESERGRGLFLIAIYLDEVRVDAAAGGGLHLRGRLAPSDAP